MKQIYKYQNRLLSPFKKTASRILKGISLPLGKIIEELTDFHKTIELNRLVRLDFIPRADDIFIVTYPKSGTTWMQMILYQLTTDGNMDFPHITAVCPWIERALIFHAMTVEELDKYPSPRIFKSHLNYTDIPKGSCRYIYVTRNGRDVVASYYYHYKAQLFYRGTFSEFFDLFMQGKVLYGSWFKHIAEWLEHKDDLNILFLQYEDLIRDLEGSIRKISDFCKIEIAPERLPEILEKCSFTFMKKYESKFDPVMEKILEKGYIQNVFLRKGKPGDGKEHLTPEQERRFDKEMEKIR